MSGRNTSHYFSSGRIMVDNETGLAGGHGPGTSFDNAGIALQSTLKAYRTIRRAMRDGESAARTEERIKAAQMTLYEKLPAEVRGRVKFSRALVSIFGQCAAIVWPAVVGFSFTAKTWGHVLIDGLSQVEFQPGVRAGCASAWP